MYAHPVLGMSRPCHFGVAGLFFSFVYLFLIVQTDLSQKQKLSVDYSVVLHGLCQPRFVQSLYCCPVKGVVFLSRTDHQTVKA